MTTWAQIVNGHAVNPIKRNPIECFTPEWLANNPPFVTVPDGTQHGAVDNGNGTFTNPAGPQPKPVVFKTGKDMAMQLIAWLGGNGAARAALGAIVKACQNSANGADNFFAYYLTLENFTKSEFLTIVNAVDVSIITAQQKTFIANNWPEA